MAWIPRACLRRLVHNSDEEELEAKLKEAIMCNEYVKRIEAKLEHEFFPDPGSLVPPVDVLSSEMRRSRTMGSEPTPCVPLPRVGPCRVATY